MPEQQDALIDRLTAHLDRGWELATRGDLAGAMASAEQTLELDADSPEAHNLIGYIHAANGNTDLALEHYRHAIETDPSCLEAMLNAAELLIHPLGDLSKAIETLDQALESCQSEEEIADTTVLKIDALIQQGDRASALELLRALPQGPYGTSQLDFLVGRACLELGEVERAAPLLEQAAQEEDAHADAYYYLGLLREAQQDRSSATMAFLKARYLDDKLPRPPWAPSRQSFERVIQAALRRLPSELTTRIEGTLIMVAELPGLEVVAEGVDPRTPLLLDDLEVLDGARRPLRVFIYQRNMERLIRQPLEIEENVVAILSAELATHLDNLQKAKPAAS